MRSGIVEFVRIADSALALQGPVYEFGARLPEHQASAIRPIFEGRGYVGCDMASGPNVDRIENLEALTLADGTVGAVVCVDTLEHVRRPEAAVAQMLRVLRPGGVLLLASVMDFPIHHYPSDYWRFTPEAFRLLLEGFEDGCVGWQGAGFHPHTVFAVAVKAPSQSAKDALAHFRRRSLDIRDDHTLSPAKRRWAKVILEKGWIRRPGFFGDFVAKYAGYDDVCFESLR